MLSLSVSFLSSAGTVDHGPLLSQAVVHTLQRGEQEGFNWSCLHICFAQGWPSNMSAEVETSTPPVEQAPFKTPSKKEKKKGMWQWHFAHHNILLCQYTGQTLGDSNCFKHSYANHCLQSFFFLLNWWFLSKTYLLWENMQWIVIRKYKNWVDVFADLLVSTSTSLAV